MLGKSIENVIPLMDSYVQSKPTHLANNLVSDRQAQPGARFFRSEERIEEFVDVFGRNAAAFINDSDVHARRPCDQRPA